MDTTDLMESYRQSSLNIIETLSYYIEGKSTFQDCLQLEKILNMITTDLTFDDPGIFFRRAVLNQNQRLIQEAFNMWLNNQLIFIFCNTEYNSLKRHITELQQEILSASYLKQRWLFTKLSTKIIKLTQHLTEFDTIMVVDGDNNNDREDCDDDISDTNMNNPPILKKTDKINEFQLSSDGFAYDLSEIIENYKFHSIEIKSLAVQTSLIENCLNLLRHIIGLAIDCEPQLVAIGISSVLSALNTMPFAVKILCIKFFSKLFNKIRLNAGGGSDAGNNNDDGYGGCYGDDEFYIKNNQLVDAATLCLDACFRIYQQLDDWFDEKIIDQQNISIFYQYFGLFLECGNSLIRLYCDTKETTLKTIDICLKIIRTRSYLSTSATSPVVKPPEKFTKSFCNFFVKIFRYSIRNSIVEFMFNDLEFLFEQNFIYSWSHHLIFLLEFELINRIKSVNCRQMVDDMINGIFMLLTNSLDRAANSDGELNFIANLKVAKSILQCFQYIEHEINKWHQNQHILTVRTHEQYVQSTSCSLCNHQQQQQQPEGEHNITDLNITNINTQNYSYNFNWISLTNFNDSFTILTTKFLTTISQTNLQNITQNSINELSKLAWYFLQRNHLANNTKELLQLAISPILHSKFKLEHSEWIYPKLLEFTTTSITANSTTSAETLETFDDEILNLIKWSNLRWLNNNNSEQIQIILKIFNKIEENINNHLNFYLIYMNFLFHGILSMDDLIDRLTNLTLKNTINCQMTFAHLMPQLICLSKGNCFITEIRLNDRLEYRLICAQCSTIDDDKYGKYVGSRRDGSFCNSNENIENCSSIKYNTNRNNNNTNINNNKPLPKELIMPNELRKINLNENKFNFLCKYYFELFDGDNNNDGGGGSDADDEYQTNVRIKLIDSLPALAEHYPEFMADNYEKWTKLFLDKSKLILDRFAKCLSSVLPSLEKSHLTELQKQQIDQQCLQQLLNSVRNSLNYENQQYQSSVLNLIRKYATKSSKLNDKTLVHCFIMMHYYLLRTQSAVAKQTILNAEEICQYHGVYPKDLFNWYQQRCFRLIITGSVANYLYYQHGLHKSLINISHLVGYREFQTHFIPQYSGIIISMLLPLCIENPFCMKLLDEVGSLQNKTLKTVLSTWFLQIYCHIYFNRSRDIFDKSMAYITNQTGLTIEQHLRTDIRKTLLEILVWYHKDPEFVLNALRIILKADTTKKSTNKNVITVEEMITYISIRFLGVLTHFGVILIARDLEKQFQQEMLLSLGELMRFMGTKHVTPFRFKILSVLNSALTIENHIELKEICAQVWKIFIYNVDVQSMGPLLSTIIVSLEPLYKSHQFIVNDILKYLIISNGNLLSLYIGDLFFLDQTLAVSLEIKNHIQQNFQSSSTSSNDFNTKLQLFTKHINHENVEVRTYAIRYATKLFKENRRDLNDLICGHQQMNRTIEECVAGLMEGCKHLDKELQMCSGTCFGMIGAIEPSLLTPNYAPQQKVPLSIHTDSFSVIALAELSRAYQFQKDTQRVDGFSLAIQEILMARGVCPEKEKKMFVWNAIPERMRQLMEPLLSSSYATMDTKLPPMTYPIFTNTRWTTSETWANQWAAAMINTITDEDTKHLLNSFKSSMRNDPAILSLCLPYVIIHTLQSCNVQNSERIENEVRAVLTAVTKNNIPTIDNNAAANLTTTTAITANITTTIANTVPLSDVTIKSAKIIFNLFDFLDRWLRQCHHQCGNKDEENYQKIELFLKKFDKKCIAVANFKCNEYARALMHLEMYIEENAQNRLQSELSFLAQIYAELLDTDSLVGALTLKQEKPTLREQIMLNNATGRLQDSTVCFEKIMQQGDVSDGMVQEVLNCYLGLDQPETALCVSQSLMKQMYRNLFDDKAISVLYTENAAEPLWRLGRFEELDELLNTTKLCESSNWGIRCGQTLLALRAGQTKNFLLEIEKCRLSVLNELRATSDEHSSYNKVYHLVMKLHLITEMENAYNVVEAITVNDGSGGGDASKVLTNLFNDWDERLKLLQPTAKNLQPVLSLRRILLNEIQQLIQRNYSVNSEITNTVTELCQNYIGKSLIKSTSLARSAEMYQQAQLFILNCDDAQSPPHSLFLEKAKLFWKKGDQTNSLITLQNGVKELELKNETKKLFDNNLEIKKVYSEAKLLLAIYSAESMNTNTHENIEYFLSAIRSNNESEKCYVDYAHYLEKVCATIIKTDDGRHDDEIIGQNYQQEILTCYGKSMMYGCQYIHQSMPRYLTIWLDFTANSCSTGTGTGPTPTAATSTTITEHYLKVAQNMNRITQKLSERLPAFMFFTAFSQLVSRICHPSQEVYTILKTILIKLIQHFPQQSLWMILSIYKSSYASRVRRCTDIFNDKRLSHRDIQKLINDFNLLAERLIELTNKNVVGSNLSVSSVYRSLPRLLADKEFSQILMPIKKFLQPILPPVDDRDRPAATYNAFPNDMVFINGIADEMMVMPSLQKPKRITLLGTDGQNYMIMMKPKDDLRKDFRLMEFNAIVNQYLYQDPDARQRRLYIRTYAVLPLNEECGILEWVLNLQSFRPIIMDYYKRHKMGMSSRELRDHVKEAKDKQSKLKLFTDIFLPRHPPVFSEWFKERFTTPHNWYLARSSYIRTTAVMSIVGYILGLGDRHGENILFDTENGDTVHVDFNCLFNKGELFEVPELVPFRLTHNMVNAMGPLGYEGLYRKCCQITMKVLQEQQPTLMSVLRPFVYDPLVSWNRINTKNDLRIERTDDKAMLNVKRIEERLKGYVKINKTITTIPLSTEGVVNHCIAEATDIEKLAAMYIGWAPYM